MKKERKILTKSDGKKIITYPDGTWCDYNDLIDTVWHLEPNDLLYVCNASGENSLIDRIILAKDNKVNHHNDCFDDWNSASWSSNNNSIEILFENERWIQKPGDGYAEKNLLVKEKVSLKGEVVFNESSRIIVGNYYADTFDLYTGDSIEREGQFTATELDEDYKVYLINE